MISMTGFGRATVDVDVDGGARLRLRVEIRSVNHRGLDLKVRAPQPDAFCEAEIGRAVRAAVERGSVTVHVREEGAASRGIVDEARVRQVHATLERLSGELGLAGAVDLMAIAAFMSASGGGGLEGEALWEALRPAVERALAELVATRKREGAALTEDLRGRVEKLGALVAKLREATAPLPERFARKIEERLAALRGQPGFEPARIAQEAALMAERLDVSEELTRLATHLAHLDELTRAAGSVGRKLDFVVQEVGRELNTTGSKSQDAGVAALVIEAKAELERLREQAANVE
ncbi:MAG TPA: YicC/YloC family endoribonuclease [Polyangia bacterium]|nr:YicC/YloC family endoribonuclease [Polyangia bacterium]